MRHFLGRNGPPRFLTIWSNEPLLSAAPNMLQDVATDYNFMAGIAACDETCVYGYDTETDSRSL